MRIVLRSVAVAVVLAVLPMPGGTGPAWPSAPAAAGAPCPRYEAPVPGVPAVANPFDPAQVDVTVELTGPGGASLSVPAFYTRDFTRALVGGFEHLTPQGTDGWLFRVTPTVAGTWQWRSVVTTPGGTTTSASTSFTCTTDPTSHGFLRRSAADPRYLGWDDGTPYVAIGENLGWYDGRGTYAYDEWLDKLAAHHATWIRVWMPSWAMGLEWLTRDGNGVIIESSLGNYTTRLDRAWQLDHVIDAAARRGIVVMLTIQNHGAFSIGANSEWADNPYNATNGGPLADPHQFFTDPTARTIFDRRLRYLVARWSYATNIIWEFWNEVDLTPTTPVSDVIAWHAAEGDALRALDPYDHLITTSLDGGQLADFVSPTPKWPPLWDVPTIDIVQLHFYGTGLAKPAKLETNINFLLNKLAVHGKPVLAAEAGVDSRGPAESLAADPAFDGLHELIWSGLFAGGAGTGMTWWWDNLIDPHDQYGQFDALESLIAGVAFDQQAFTSSGVTASAPGHALTVRPLRGTTTSLAWIRTADDWWHVPDTATIDGATVTIDGLTDGAWDARWMDPYTGAWSNAGTITVSAGHASLAVPTFSREIALRLDQAQVPPTTTTTTAPATTTTTTAGPTPTSTTVLEAPPSIVVAPAHPIVAVPSFTA